MKLWLQGLIKRSVSALGILEGLFKGSSRDSQGLTWVVGPETKAAEAPEMRRIFSACSASSDGRLGGFAVLWVCKVHKP